MFGRGFVNKICFSVLSGTSDPSSRKLKQRKLDWRCPRWRADPQACICGTSRILQGTDTHRNRNKTHPAQKLTINIQLTEVSNDEKRNRISMEPEFCRNTVVENRHTR